MTVVTYTIYINDVALEILTGARNYVESIYFEVEVNKILFADTYYVFKLTKEQYDEAILPDGAALNVGKLTSLNLDFEIFQLGRVVGVFTQVKAGEVKFVDTEEISNVISEMTQHNFNLLICRYCWFNNEGDNLSIVSLHYNKARNAFTFNTQTDSNEEICDILADEDDPLLTDEDIPTVLEYLRDILKNKTKAWEEHAEVV